MSAASLTNLNALRCVAAQYDFAIHGGAVSDIGLRVSLPKGAIVVNAFAEVLTAPTSADSTATIAIKVEGANDIFTAAAVSGAPWSTTGMKQAIPDLATVADYKKATVDREVTMSIAVQALTAGKFNVFIFYVHNTAQ